MNHKDDTEFITASHSAVEREVLLRRLLSMRRIHFIGGIGFLAFIALTYFAQLFAPSKIEVHNGLLLGFMINLLGAIHSDMKIKILLIQRQAEQVGAPNPLSAVG